MEKFSLLTCQRLVFFPGIVFRHPTAFAMYMRMYVLLSTKLKESRMLQNDDCNNAYNNSLAYHDKFPLSRSKVAENLI